MRDLHAGPARFSEIQSSLSGMAPNLLTERLRALESAGLIQQRDAGYNVSVYELTELGSSTGALLFELAKFGSQFQPAEDLVRPGNLRTIAVTLKMALASVVTPDEEMRIELRVDDEPFDICISGGNVSVLYRSAEDPEAIVATSYVPLLAVGDGQMSAEEFASEHVELVAGSGAQAERLFELVSDGFGRTG